MQFMLKVSKTGENDAYILRWFPQIVFVSAHRGNQGLYFVVDREVYKQIRSIGWTNTRGYIRMSSGDHTYLQVFMFPHKKSYTLIHHNSHLFLYLYSTLEEMTTDIHPHERAYPYECCILTCNNIKGFLKMLKVHYKVHLRSFDKKCKRYKVIKC